MKKAVAIGMTALALTAACVPMTAQAATAKSTCQKTANIQVVNIGQNCNMENVKSALAALGVNTSCLNNTGSCTSNTATSKKNSCRQGNTCNATTTTTNTIKDIIQRATKNTNKNNSKDSTTPSQSVEPSTPIETEKETANSAYAQQVVDLVNAERAKEGLPALKIDKNLEAAALVRAKEIQTSFSHTRPNGSSFSTAIKENGVTYKGAGENIAWGQKTPEEVVKAWMNSPGHRANIMDSNYTKIGVGNLQNSSGTQYWAQLFTY